MNNQNLQCKLEYFHTLSNNEYQCLICLKTIFILETGQNIDQLLNEHFLSIDHLQNQLNLGFFQGQQFKQKFQNKSSDEVQLFNMQTAIELKTESKEQLNQFFGTCIKSIDGIIHKGQTTQKAYLIILKRFYNFAFDQQTSQFKEDNILKFLEVEKLQHDSVAALSLLAKALGCPFSINILEQIQKKRVIQQEKNFEKSKTILEHCKQLIVYLQSCSQKSFALIIFLIFELDLEINMIPNLRFEDI